MEAEATQISDVVNQTDTHDSKSPAQSFAELRKAKEDTERQLWQAKKELELERTMQANVQRQHQSVTPQEEDYDYRQLEQEEYPDGKKLVKAFSTMNNKMSSYEKKLAEKDQKIQILEAAQQYTDFKDVVTVENIEKYINTDEDHLEAVKKAEIPLRKVYNLIKKDARYQKDISEKQKPISQEQKRVDEKENKPQHTSVGVRSEAITAAAKMSNSQMTKEFRNKLWEETQQAAKKR